MSLHLKLLDIDHPLTFEESKLRQIQAHALIYLSIQCLLPTVTLAILCTPNTCIMQNRAKVLIMRRPQDKVDALTSISTVIYVNIC